MPARAPTNCEFVGLVQQRVENSAMAKSGKDYYRILEISKDAKEGDIKKAYKKAAMKW
jgi:preprotein translocase subunit Sec63